MTKRSLGSTLVDDGIMLKLRNLYSGYGQSPVLSGISLDVLEGQIVSLIGANGAGKTTTLKTIVGLLTPTSGKVEFKGKDISGIFPPQAVDLGISMVFEGRRVFPSLSVLENLKVGAYTRPYRQVNELLEEMLEFFPRLKKLRTRLAGSLSGGEQQMLAIARALMASPTLLLLDEPSMGLAPVIVDQILEKLLEFRRRRLTVLMVEQNALLALEIADHAYVIENGRITKAGPARSLIHDPEVERSYLGLSTAEGPTSAA